jgi:hypothetical protein
MSPILGIIASQNYPRDTNSYESIQTVTVGAGGTSSISFSSIPSTYKHLQIRMLARSNRASDLEYLKINFNSDTAANYSWHYVLGNGAGTAAGAGANASYVFSEYYAGAAQGSNIFGAGITDILDYQNTNKFKTIRDLAGTDNNGATNQGTISYQSGSWRSTSAISSIQITPGGGTTIQQYSSFALYGIKG